MNWESLVNSGIIENLGWTLIHSVWQIAVVAIVLYLILWSFKNYSANVKYLLAVSALTLTFFLPAATFIFLNNSLAHSEESGVSETEETDVVKKQDRPPQNFPLVNGNYSQSENSAGEASSFSFENLQVSLKQHLTSSLPLLVLLWISGMTIYAFRLIGGFWQLHKYKTVEVSEPPADWRTRFSNLCRKLKVTQTVRLGQSNIVKTPIVVGWLKPLILVPASVFLQMNPRELETILAHELMHIRRYDNLVNFVQSFVEILFFYHPGARWISGVIRREREFACDDAVLGMANGGQRIVYAEALANLEEIRLLTNEKTSPVVMAASGGKLMKRIERILEKNAESQSSSKQSFLSASLALLLISAVLISVFSAQTALSVNSNLTRIDKKIAIGFVSIPPIDRSENPPHDMDATARLLIEKLKSHRIPAIGFLQGSTISDGNKFYPVQTNVARLWRDAGMEVGIGNFNHVWFYNTPYDEYVAGVAKNEAVAKKLLGEKNLSLKYFSYPFLNTGKNADERNRFEAWLKQQGMTPVKYTIDNQEWMYSFAYDIARNDNDVNTMKQIQSEFLDYMSKMFDHFEKYSQGMFGRDIAQTMVLTPSRLVADSGDELFGMIEKRGYRFVSMDDAQKDEAYNTPESFYGRSGISWFERWQMAQGKKLLDEPNITKTAWDIWNKNKPKTRLFQ